MRPLSFPLACSILALLPSCAPRSATSRLYPPRPRGYKMALVFAPEPGIEADDLGVAAVICHVNTPYRQCLNQLRAEACRMGADILYDVPDGPIRPTEQGVVYRGRAAHTRDPQFHLPPRQPAEAADGEIPDAAAHPALTAPSGGGIDEVAVDAGAPVSPVPATWGTTP